MRKEKNILLSAAPRLLPVRQGAEIFDHRWAVGPMRIPLPAPAQRMHLPSASGSAPRARLMNGCSRAPGVKTLRRQRTVFSG